MKSSAVFALAIVCACIVGDHATSPLVGGLGRTKNATPEIQSLVDSVSTQEFNLRVPVIQHTILRDKSIYHNYI
jgi:hypothetical protein